MRRALLIIAQTGYQDKEYLPTRGALEHAGFAVSVASPEGGTCTGKFGGTVQADLKLEDVKVTDFDRVGFIGGPGAHELADNPEALRIAFQTIQEQKKLGAICIAPTILAKAKVLQGRKATVWNKDEKTADILTQAGAEYTGEMVTVDGDIVTGNGPETAEEFGATFAAL